MHCVSIGFWLWKITLEQRETKKCIKKKCLTFIKNEQYSGVAKTFVRSEKILWKNYNKNEIK